mmetsp:Transcript_2102/g.4295  ORF Transcript_2102/g.4295 Transcript_2102/m.4295 type:complete len:83 (+) Transcript_2102:697-945(+)
MDATHCDDMGFDLDLSAAPTSSSTGLSLPYSLPIGDLGSCIEDVNGRDEVDEVKEIEGGPDLDPEGEPVVVAILSSENRELR